MFEDKTVRLIDPITKWKLMCSQIALAKSSSKLKWKILATKARVLSTNNNECHPDLSSFSFYINFLNTAMDCGFVFHPKKCAWPCPEVTYLGFILIPKGSLVCKSPLPNEKED